MKDLNSLFPSIVFRDLEIGSLVDKPDSVRFGRKIINMCLSLNLTEL